MVTKASLKKLSLFALGFLGPLIVVYATVGFSGGRAAPGDSVLEFADPLRIRNGSASLAVSGEVDRTLPAHETLGAWISLSELPGEGSQLRVLKFEGREGGVVSEVLIARDGGSYRPLVRVWRSGVPEAERYFFDPVAILPNRWFLLAVTIRHSTLIALHSSMYNKDERSYELVFRGAHEVTTPLPRPLRSTITFGGQGATVRERFHGEVGRVSILSFDEEGPSLKEELLPLTIPGGKTPASVVYDWQGGKDPAINLFGLRTHITNTDRPNRDRRQ